MAAEGSIISAINNEVARAGAIMYAVAQEAGDRRNAITFAETSLGIEKAAREYETTDLSNRLGPLPRDSTRLTPLSTRS